jgi:hypothetical protein
MTTTLSLSSTIEDLDPRGGRTNMVSFPSILLLSCLLMGVQGHHQPSRLGRYSARCFVPRGGAGDMTNSEISAIGVLTGSKDQSGDVPSRMSWLFQASGATCFLLDGSSSLKARIENLPSDDFLAESLGVICNVMVVHIADRDEEDLSRLIQAVVKGSNRRGAARLKNKLVIVSSFQEPKIEDGPSCSKSYSKDEFIKKQLANVIPGTFERVEVVTLEELEQRWEDILREPPASSVSFGDTLEVYPKLIQQVYRALGGTSQSTFQLKPFIETSRKRRKHMEDAGMDIIIQEVLSTAQTRLEALETKMNEIWLEETSQEIPLLEFGDMANDLLNDAYQRLQLAPSAMRLQILQRVAAELLRLYKQQLESLRDYYGKRYETVLETQENQEAWTEAAAHMTEGFRAAAQQAIPTLCQSSGELRDADFEYVMALQGLIKDMMEATQSRQDEQSMAMEDESDDDEESLSRHPPKWYEKLAARALVLGVNYLQGWLAWQGVKRAAIERDRNMPKFPLF